MGGYLTVILKDSPDDATGRMLTARTDGNAGQFVGPFQPHMLPFEFVTPLSKASTLLIFFARSQTEQPATASHAQSRIENISPWSRDDKPALEITRRSHRCAADLHTAEAGPQLVRQLIGAAGSPLASYVPCRWTQEDTWNTERC
jgi:hypothetical protein